MLSRVCNMACRIRIFASLPLLSSENMYVHAERRRRKKRRDGKACASAMKSNRTCGCCSSTFSERNAPGEDCNREGGFRV
jgi:hypothetical protein